MHGDHFAGVKKGIRIYQKRPFGQSKFQEGSSANLKALEKANWTVSTRNSCAFKKWIYSEIDCREIFCHRRTLSYWIKRNKVISSS